MLISVESDYLLRKDESFFMNYSDFKAEICPSVCNWFYIINKSGEVHFTLNKINNDHQIY